VQPLLQRKGSKYYLFRVHVFGLFIQHTHPLRHIVICGLIGSTAFFQIISQTTRFSKEKKKALSVKCVS
jgi:hypothetical protein